MKTMEYQTCESYGYLYATHDVHDQFPAIPSQLSEFAVLKQKTGAYGGGQRAISATVHRTENVRRQACKGSAKSGHPWSWILQGTR